jgi:hypothetical protein
VAATLKAQVPAALEVTQVLGPPHMLRVPPDVIELPDVFGVMHVFGPPHSLMQLLMHVFGPPHALMQLLMHVLGPKDGVFEEPAEEPW